MILSNLVCPISTVQIDSNVSRTTVMLNVVLMGVFLLTMNPIWMVIVSLDYLIRASPKGKYSPIRQLALILLSPFKLEAKPTGQAPKMFASRLGLICAVLACLFILIGMPVASIISAGLLMVLSFMDSAFNLCVGCLIYHFVVFPFYKDK